MYVYFVRHGCSTLGEERKYQFSDTPLSEQGRTQSQLIADRLNDLDFDILISSPFKRALETTDIINVRHNKSIEVSGLFQESRQPSEIEGKSRDDPDSINILEQVAANLHNDDWRYSNEETFIELRGRGIRALDYLIKTNKEKVLVVTHGDFLRLIVSIMQHGEAVAPSLFNTFRTFATIKNVGFTVCYYGPPKYNKNGKKLWYLISWNDDAHLI